MNAPYERGLVLFNQSRYDLAARELRQALAVEPDNSTAHALLALCLSNLCRYHEATQEAREAIRLHPDDAYNHYSLANVLYDRNRPSEAEAAISEAVRIDPEQPRHYSMLANIRYMQGRLPAALEAAEQGLRLDAEHAGCNNIRALTLVKLNRGNEAAATLRAALAIDPENSYTHANQGWALLDRGEPAKAMEHFAEALRLDPCSEWARQGILEALRARYLVYRVMRRFYLAEAKSDRRNLSGLIFAIVLLGYGLLHKVATWIPALEPLTGFIWVAYVGFLLLTWTAEPLFNVLLRFNRFGRLVLSHDEVVASTWVGGCVGLALVSLGGWFLNRDSTMTLLLAGFFGFLIIPIAGTFGCQEGGPREAMATCTFCMAVVGVMALALHYRGIALSALLGYLYVFAGLLSIRVASHLAEVRPPR